MKQFPAKANKSHTIAVRLSPAVDRTFTTLSVKYGGKSEVMRELIMAFIENRLTIEPPKTFGTLYDIGK